MSEGTRRTTSARPGGASASNHNHGLEGQAAAGDPAQRQALIESHLWLVRSMVHRYSCYGVSPIDLYSEGTLGLVQAADHFDPSKGVPFGAYASLWVKQAIARAVPSLRYAVRIPLSLLRRMVQLDHDLDELSQALQRAPEAGELAALLADLPLSVDELRLLPLEPLSLDGQWSDELPGALRGEQVPDPDATSPEAAALAAADDERVRQVLSALTPRERDIVVRRLGLFGAPEQSLAAIAAGLGLSRQRVQQIERKALEKLRSRGVGREAWGVVNVA